MSNARNTKIENNPGAYKKYIPPSWKNVAYRAKRNIQERHWRGLLNGFVTDLLNKIFFMPLMANHLPSRFRCVCCGTSAASFVHLSNERGISWYSACPACDSRSRHRGLAVLLPEILKDKPEGYRLLHFAPEPVLKPVFQTLPNIKYQTADFYLKDVDFPDADLRCLPFPGGSFDAVLCNHVLEHIDRDDLAVAELARILKPEGLVVVTIPGDWQNEKTVSFPGLSQNGHYRHYGRDVLDLFRVHFSKVEMEDLHRFDSSEDGHSHAIHKKDFAFICRKK